MSWQPGCRTSRGRAALIPVAQREVSRAGVWWDWDREMAATGHKEMLRLPDGGALVGGDGGGDPGRLGTRRSCKQNSP